MPMAISIMPPASSARDLYLEPKALPASVPATDRTNVVAAIIPEAMNMFTLRKAKDTPTASASILVATARGSMAFHRKEGSGQLSALRDSQIILPPMKARRTKAIQ